VSSSLWLQCLQQLQEELPATEFSMWVRPLQAELSDNTLTLFAPNRFVLDWVRDKYLNSINRLLYIKPGMTIKRWRILTTAQTSIQSTSLITLFLHALRALRARYGKSTAKQRD